MIDKKCEHCHFVFQTSTLCNLTMDLTKAETEHQSVEADFDTDKYVKYLLIVGIFPNNTYILIKISVKPFVELSITLKWIQGIDITIFSPAKK